MIQKIKDNIFLAFLKLVCAWVTVALLFEIFVISVSVYDYCKDTSYSQTISNEIAWKLDGTFKDIPGNISYKKNK